MDNDLRDFRAALAEALSSTALPQSALSLWGADLSQTSKDSAQSTTESVVLSKFLRARDGNIPEALSMLLKTLQVSHSKNYANNSQAYMYSGDMTLTFLGS
jgi:hypothetical protein